MEAIDAVGVGLITAIRRPWEFVANVARTPTEVAIQRGHRRTPETVQTRGQ